MRREPIHSITIADEMDIADIRRIAKELATGLNFPSAKTYRLVTAVSELATNLHFHALPGGAIRLAEIGDAGRIGIEVVAEDKGPGIPDIALAMRDGFSTKRSLGGGLPGTQRLMDEFSIESEVGVGTRIVARLWRS